MKSMIAIAVLAVFALPAAAQQHQPYSGQEARDAKALSAEEVKQYLSGAGMGYAKAAELTAFPARSTRSSSPISLALARSNRRRSRR